MIGVVVIGRNEGERLRRCLESLAGKAGPIVYVDSGSTDGSLALARSLGAETVELDLLIPFTAARARNAGFTHLNTLRPEIDYVQFVDGDCEVASDWLDAGGAFLADHPKVSVVCGRRRERFPERSIYNRLCDLEWDTPVGETKACGGDALMRVSAFKSVGGFRESLIAGEEPELCVRLRSAGWEIWRLDAEMTLHDAAMTRFGQWWKRSMRGGFAFAEGAYLHGAPPERHWVRESLRIWAWSLVPPMVAMVAMAVFGVNALLVLAIYPLQVVRLALKRKYIGKDNWLHAFFLVLGKFPELQGQLSFWWRKVGAGRTALIEYK